MHQDNREDGRRRGPLLSGLKRLTSALRISKGVSVIQAGSVYARNLKLVVLFLLIGTLCACTAGGGGGGTSILDSSIIPGLILPKSSAKKLDIVQAIPQGSLVMPQQCSTLTVVFSQPMVNLGTKEVNIPGLAIEPDIKGEWKWRGTACLTFTPKEDLAVSHDYKVTIPSGVTSLTGLKLLKPYTFSFTTPRPVVLDSRPKDGARNIALDAPIMLLFNQQISSQSELERITLSSSSGPVEVSLRVPTTAEFDAYIKELTNDDHRERITFNNVSVKASELSPNQMIVLQPKQKLKQGEKYTVVVPSGFKVTPEAQQGSLAAQSLSFKTYEIFSLKSFNGGDGNRPENGVCFSFTNPVQVKELAQALSFEPKVELSKSLLEDDFSSDTHYFDLPLSPRTSYKVNIAKSLKDEFGNTISKAEQLSFTTTDFAPIVKMSEGNALVEAKLGKPQIPLASVNVGSLHVQGKPLTAQEAIELVKDSNLYNKDYKPSSGFTYDQTITIKNELNREIITNLDLTPILKAKSNGSLVEDKNMANGKDEKSAKAKEVAGLLFLRLSYKDASGEMQYGNYFVQVTDLCLTAKFSADNNLLWITSLDSGKPVPGAKVTLYDDKAKAVFTGTSNDKGLVQAPGWAKFSKKSKEYGAPSHYFTASLGSDTAFISSDSNNHLYASNADIYSYMSGHKEEYMLKAFTDKGIYNLEEKLYFKGMLRSVKDSQLVIPQSCKQLKYEVFDSNENSLAKGVCQISQTGSFDGALTIPAKANTGYSRISFSIAEDLAKKLDTDAYVGSCGFRIEDYQPVQSETKVTSKQTSLIAGQELKASIEGCFLFGAPMSGDQCHYTAVGRRDYYVSEKFPNFNFSTTYASRSDDEEMTVNLLTGRGQLDDVGQLKVNVPTQSLNFTSPGSVVIDASVISSNLREVAGRLVLPIWPASSVVGLKLNNFIAEENKPVEGKLVALDPQENICTGAKVNLELIRREWNSVRKAGVGGAYHWVSEMQDQVVATQTVTCGNEPTPFNFTPDKAGTYVVRATVSDDREHKSVSEDVFWCCGNNYVAWERDDSDEINLKPDASVYAPNSTAKILVQSPYEKAEALVTVESDGILKNWQTTLEGSTPVIEVPLQANYAPNVYVSVVMVKGREGKTALDPQGLDLSKPSFKFGYANLKIDDVKSKLNVELLSDLNQYRPGETVTVTAKLTNSDKKPVSGEIALWVVDEGVLSLIDYKVPDFQKYFYAERSLKVVTMETCADVIGLRAYGSKGANDGGGGGDDESGGIRENFTPVAVWKPSIKVDDRGMATIHFQLPDNLTRYRIMAVACSGSERFGKAQTNIEVNKPLVLLPAVLKYAREGDSFQVGVVAHNNTKETSTVKVKAQSDDLNIAGEVFSSTLAPSEKRLMYFEASAPKIGTFPITFTGDMGNNHDACRYSLEVVPESQTNVVAVSGSFTGNSAQEPLKIPVAAKEGTASLDTAISNNFTSQLDGAVQDIWKGQEMGLSDILNRLETLLVASDGLELPKKVNGAKERDLAIKSYQRELSRFVTSEGGLSPWSGYGVSDLYYTAWGLEVLSQLRNQKLLINDSLRYQILGYAKEALDKETGKFSEGTFNSDLPRLFYALCENGEGQSSTLVVLYRSRQKFDLAGQAYLLMAAHKLNNKDITATLRRELSNYLKVEERQAWFELPSTDYLASVSTRVRDNAIILRAMLTSGDFAQSAKVMQWIFTNKRDGHWPARYADVAVIKAVICDMRQHPVPAKPIKVKARLGGLRLVDGTLGRDSNGKLQSCVNTSTAIKGIGRESMVEFSKDGAGAVYYSLVLHYAPQEPMPATDNGFTIFETCASADKTDQPIDFKSLRAGQVYQITITVLSPVTRDRVAVDVPLAAGLEVVNPTFSTESNLYSNLINSANSQSYYGTFTNAEFYRDHVKIIADGLQAGEHTYSFLVRAASAGLYRLPGALVYQQDRPEVFGCTAETSVKVAPAP